MTETPTHTATLWPPQRLLGLCSLLGLFLVGLGLWTVMTQPWIGIRFNTLPERQGLQILSVAPSHPNADRLEKGQVIRAVMDNGNPIVLTDTTVTPEPDVLDYRQAARFYQQQTRLATLLAENRLTVTRDNGKLVTLSTRQQSARAVPGIFLAHVIYGLGALVITVSLWAFRPRQRATQLLAASGVGFFFCNMGPAIYASRELALNGQWFSLLSGLNHFGVTLMTVSLVALMWVYPRPISRVPMPAFLFVIAGLSFLADQLHLGNSPAQTHYLPMIALYGISLVFTVIQWRNSRHQPRDRASLGWLVLALFWACLTIILLVMLPPVVGLPPFLPQHGIFAVCLIMYLGVAAGVARYRLFALEAWWLRSWLWVLGGATVLLFDGLLVWLTGMRPAPSLLLSLIIAGFIYFPLRQWLWTRLSPTGEQKMDETLPQLATQLLTAPTHMELAERWPEVMSQAFQPLHCHLQNGSVNDVSVSSDGCCIEVPHPFSQHHLELCYPGGGTRLFRRNDLRLARALATFIQHSRDALDARVEGATHERERILGDLHDDIGAKLLTVVHGARDSRAQELARSALSDLRTLVSARQQPALPLETALNLWQTEFEQRLSQGEATPDWQIHGTVPDISLSPTVYGAIERILREAVTNALRHGQASHVQCRITVSLSRLVFDMSDNGRRKDSTWQPGSGLRNMHHRAWSIGAMLSIQDTGTGGTQILLDYPLLSP